jgi:hypothetical protein
MTTRADSWGGSTPPRPAGPGNPAGQWFRFGPWLYDVDAATETGFVARDTTFGVCW